MQPYSLVWYLKPSTMRPAPGVALLAHLTKSQTQVPRSRWAECPHLHGVSPAGTYLRSPYLCSMLYMLFSVTFTHTMKAPVPLNSFSSKFLRLLRSELLTLYTIVSCFWLLMGVSWTYVLSLKKQYKLVEIRGHIIEYFWGFRIIGKKIL